MTSHKHAEMIKAKADNMELVVFCKGINDGCEWHEVKRFPTWQDNASYFLCLPKHNENGQCLHWLNGGLVEWTREEENGERWFGKEKYTSIAGWNATNGWMLDDNIYRIKPRKEKRWIGFNNRTNITTSTLYKSLDAVKNATVRHEEWQFIEIEVEV